MKAKKLFCNELQSVYETSGWVFLPSYKCITKLGVGLGKTNLILFMADCPKDKICGLKTRDSAQLHVSQHLPWHEEKQNLAKINLV